MHLTIPSFPLRMRAERERRAILLRFFFGRWSEFAYIVLGLRRLELKIEFPSDWHEQAMGWLTVGLGFVTFAVAFPWKWVVPDHYQCSGPQFGFRFFADGLHLHWGKCKGTRDDPMKIIGMPWRWKHRLHEVLGDPEQKPFRYVLKTGEVQDRIATIKPERRVWTRSWLPWRREERYIDIEFNNEVGERSGTWKGGVLGMSFAQLPGERPVDTLHRMQRERTVI